jgi:hypothetical protein
MHKCTSYVQAFLIIHHDCTVGTESLSRCRQKVQNLHVIYLWSQMTYLGAVSELDLSFEELSGDKITVVYS